MTKPLRVIFDRSSFHGSNFDKIKASPLKRLVKRERVRVFHTQVLLNETLAAYGAGKRATRWREHILFLVEICNGGIFLDKRAIWQNELVVGQGPNARNLIPNRRTKRYRESLSHLLARLTHYAETGELAEVWAESRQEMEIGEQKKTNQRRLKVESRKKMERAIKSRTYNNNLKNYTFREFRDETFVDTGRRFMDLVNNQQKDRLADLWTSNTEQFPFYSEFINGALFDFYHATVLLNKKIDRNSQPDYEQLAHLLWADIMVSDDQKFFKDAFDELWRPRGKRLLTHEGLISLTERLAGR